MAKQLRVYLTKEMRAAIAEARKNYSAAEIAGKAKAAGEPGVIVGAVFAYANGVKNPERTNQYWGK